MTNYTDRGGITMYPSGGTKGHPPDLHVPSKIYTNCDFYLFPRSRTLHQPRVDWAKFSPGGGILWSPKSSLVFLGGFYLEGGPFFRE